MDNSNQKFRNPGSNSIVLETNFVFALCCYFLLASLGEGFESRGQLFFLDCDTFCLLWWLWYDWQI